MVASAETVLLALASVIILGFLGQLFVRATRVSDVLLLIGFGVLLAAGLQIFDTSAFVVLAPVIGTFALLVILFDGGLDLRVQELIHGLARGTLLALVGFLLTVAAVGAVAHYLLGLDWQLGLLLGCIVGGSSAIVVLPAVKRMRVSEATRITLSLESAITDVFCVVGALTLASIIALQADPDVQAVGRSVVASFAIAFSFGIVAGVAWLKLLDTGLTHGASYVLTLAFVLVLHVVTTVLNGSGPVAVLVLGVLLGNAPQLRRVLRLRTEGFRRELRAFQSEVAFVTRAFFFVYLGLLLDPSAFGLSALAAGVLIVAALAAARAVAVLVVGSGSRLSRSERTIWWAMMPRGLAAAVLASVPSLTFGISGTDQFVTYAALTIILTNIIGSVAGLFAPRTLPEPGTKGAARPEPEEPDLSEWGIVR